LFVGHCRSASPFCILPKAVPYTVAGGEKGFRRRTTEKKGPHMYDADTKGKFIGLRAKGLSLARIAKRLDVSVRTLVEWNKLERENIRALRALELEALHEKILASHADELKTLKANLDRIEFQIMLKDHKYEPLSNLYRMAALVRSEIRRSCESAQVACELIEQPKTAMPPQPDSTPG
jgi:hypothetical protein